MTSVEELDGVGVSACRGGENGTCVTHVHRVAVFPPFSSTLALVVLVAMVVGIILVSLATSHLHKRKLRKRKIQRAQEEYERDSRNPKDAGARPRHPRTTLVRPPGRDPSRPVHEEEGLSTSPDVLRMDTSPDVLRVDSGAPRDHGGEEHTLHTVVSS